MGRAAGIGARVHCELAGLIPAASGPNNGGGAVGQEPGPVAEAARITSLDLIRGVAVLGILLMNAVSFRYGLVPYLNLSAGGSETGLDWAVGIVGEIFIDQKFMGLFSLLFGAGVTLFIERAARRGRRAIRLNLWRNVLLFAVGLLHYQLWDGDVLMVYALCSVILLALRRLPPGALSVAGVAIYLLPIANDFWMQSIVNATDAALVGIWTEPGADIEEAIGLSLVFNYFMRALGMMLIGAGLYRLGFMHGSLPTALYLRTAGAGIGVGLTLAALGVVLIAAKDFSREVAFIGNTANNLGSIPAALGYLSVLILWNREADNRLKRRLRAAGRMALTNYLAQSVLGVLILAVLLEDVTVNRSGILLFVLGVWGLQLWWSEAWLNRFRFGPAEWLWRVGTYRRRQQLRRV